MSSLRKNISGHCDQSASPRSKMEARRAAAAACVAIVPPALKAWRPARDILDQSSEATSVMRPKA